MAEKIVKLLTTNCVLYIFSDKTTNLHGEITVNKKRLCNNQNVNGETVSEKEVVVMMQAKAGAASCKVREMLLLLLLIRLTSTLGSQ